MRAFYAFCAVVLVFGSVSEAKFDDFEDEEDLVEYDDNDFAEFEDVMEDAVTESPQRVITTEDDEDETTVELEGQDENQEGDFEDADTQEGDTESEPYDDEEFEGYEDKPDTSSSKNKDPITIVDVPAHLQNSWESYYLEILMVTGLLAYIMNYIIGKNKNSRLAQAWFNSHRELLESNFTLVESILFFMETIKSFNSKKKPYLYWPVQQPSASSTLGLADDKAPACIPDAHRLGASCVLAAVADPILCSLITSQRNMNG